MLLKSIWVQASQPKKTDHSREKAILFATVILLVIWLSVVIFAVIRHEFWRDEVRALSQARQANSPLDLYNIIQYDGHPVLWFFLLFIGKSISGSSLVLPVIAITVGFAAVFPLYVLCPISTMV